MWRLDRPAIDVALVFSTCARGVRDGDLRERLGSVQPLIVTAAQQYDAAAQAATLHTIIPTNGIAGIVTTTEMVAMYDNRFVPRRASGRKFYDQIMISAPRHRCPLCGHGRVSTLDHGLPKQQHPALAVTPSNLVPTCADCNKAKLDDSPASANEVLLHPYFDNVENDNWLCAELVQTMPPAVRFFVGAPQNWSAVLRDRVERHFSVLKLAVLYSSQAANELVGIRDYLQALHDAGGADAVEKYLREMAKSQKTANRNSWQSALYVTLSESDWFCNEGLFSLS